MARSWSKFHEDPIWDFCSWSNRFSPIFWTCEGMFPTHCTMEHITEFYNGRRQIKTCWALVEDSSLWLKPIYFSALGLRLWVWVFGDTACTRIRKHHILNPEFSLFEVPCLMPNSSSNQTWRAGSSTRKNGWISQPETSIFSSGFPIASHDETEGYHLRRPMLGLELYIRSLPSASACLDFC